MYIQDWREVDIDAQGSEFETHGFTHGFGERLDRRVSCRLLHRFGIGCAKDVLERQHGRPHCCWLAHPLHSSAFLVDGDPRRRTITAASTRRKVVQRASELYHSSEIIGTLDRPAARPLRLVRTGLRIACRDARPNIVPENDCCAGHCGRIGDRSAKAQVASGGIGPLTAVKSDPQKLADITLELPVLGQPQRGHGIASPTRSSRPTVLSALYTAQVRRSA